MQFGEIINEIMRLHEQKELHLAESAKLKGQRGGRAKAAWHRQNAKSISIKMGGLIQRMSPRGASGACEQIGSFEGN